MRRLAVRTLLTALTALMLFATPVVADKDWGFKDLVEDYELAEGIRCSSLGKSCSEIFNLFQMFAKQGNIEAQYYLGRMYANGRGIRRKCQKKRPVCGKRQPRKDMLGRRGTLA